jgi:hypothetical protein
MIDLLMAQYASTLPQVSALVQGVDDARLAEQFPGAMNHPAWTLGHLCTAGGFALALLDEPGDAPARDMQVLYGPGSQPKPDRSLYMPRHEALARLTAIHARAAVVVPAKHADYFARPSPESLRQWAPTIGQLVFYLLAAHESYHIGQLAQWRKAAGLTVT